jgi:hypothetical protein
LECLGSGNRKNCYEAQRRRRIGRRSSQNGGIVKYELILDVDEITTEDVDNKLVLVKDYREVIKPINFLRNILKQILATSISSKLFLELENHATFFAITFFHTRQVCKFGEEHKSGRERPSGTKENKAKSATFCLHFLICTGAGTLFLP